MELDRHNIDSLTPRQTEVFELVAKGLTNTEISAALKVSASTVKTHMAALFRTLDVTNRTEAVGLFSEMAQQGAEPERAARRAPPAVAVIPFAVPTEDLAARQFADAVVEDLITRVSRCWFPVIARCSSFAASSEPNQNARTRGAELGAQFLVEGSVARDGDRVRLHARMVDTESGRILWGESFESAAIDLFALQDELCGRVVQSLSNALLNHVAIQALSDPGPKLQPWELAARGMWHYWRGTQEDNNTARMLSQEALAHDPASKLALYGAALTCQSEVLEQWGAPETAVAELEKAASRFAEIHPDDPWAQLINAYTHVYRGDRTRALEETDGALEREPSLMRAHLLRGQVLAMDGRSEEALGALDTALRLSPRDPSLSRLECSKALAHFVAERYERAVYWAGRAANRPAAGGLPCGVLASSYAHLGQETEARQAFMALKRRQPGFSAEHFQPVLASTRREIAERYLQGIFKAAR